MWVAFMFSTQFNLVCLVGPQTPELIEAEKKLKDKYGGFPYSCSLTTALSNYFTDIDHDHPSMDALRNSAQDVTQAVERVIKAFQPLLCTEERPQRNIFITGFPFTAEQAAHLWNIWGAGGNRLIIHFLESASDGEAWENGKELLKLTLKGYASEFHVL
jgi:hypothetical protein